MIAPILEELAVEQSDKFTIGKLDVDVNSRRYEFLRHEHPELLLFKDGKSWSRKCRRQNPRAPAPRDLREPVVTLSKLRIAPLVTRGAAN